MTMTMPATKTDEEIISDVFHGDLSEANRQRPSWLTGEFESWSDVVELIRICSPNSMWGRRASLFNR